MRPARLSFGPPVDDSHPWWSGWTWRPLTFAPGLAALLLILGCGPGDKPSPPEAHQASASQIIATPSGIQMALIPAGDFIMGDDNGDTDEKPAHKVQVSAFYMDTREVTQGTYERLIEKNPSKFKAPDKPVEQVDWSQAAFFCNMRSLKEHLKPCYDSKTLDCDFAADGYRLPTEAEWEYACRGGTRTRYPFGDDSAKLRNSGWFKQNADQTTHPVGQKSPNQWGLYDMHGNTAEWCHDVYGESYYRKNEAKDPRGPSYGDKRVLRGGSWRSSDDGCRCSARNSETPRFADACFGSDGYGFRCVRKAP